MGRVSLAWYAVECTAIFFSYGEFSPMLQWDGLVLWTFKISNLAPVLQNKLAENNVDNNFLKFSNLTFLRKDAILMITTLHQIQSNLPKATTQNVKPRWSLLRAWTILDQNFASLAYGNFITSLSLRVIEYSLQVYVHFFFWYYPGMQ